MGITRSGIQQTVPRAGKPAADPQFQKALENVQVVPDYRDAPEFDLNSALSNTSSGGSSSVK